MELKGSYTIEAALLMPFLLGVLILMIDTAFYLHDRMVIEKAAGIGALRGSLQRQLSDLEIKDATEKECNELVKNKLLSVRNVNTSIKVTSKQVEVTMEGRVWMPLTGGITAWFHRPAFFIHACRKAVRLEQVKFIRGVKRIRALSEEFLTGGGEH